jgi:hypothetical protein
MFDCVGTGFGIVIGLIIWGAAPATAVFGMVIVIRRKVRLTRRCMLQGRLAVIAGLVTIVFGTAFFVLEMYWAVVDTARDW